MGEVATERSDLQEGFDSLEPVVVDVHDQWSWAEVRKACEGPG